jgi:hypothetical protein
MADHPPLFEGIPPLEFFSALEQDLGVPSDFFHHLLDDNDWSFVIKLHALIETSITHALVTFFDKPELRSVFSRLPLASTSTGKLAFVQELQLLDRPSVRFVQALAELRNGFAHNPANVVITLGDFLAQSPNKDSLESRFRWGYSAAKDIRCKVDDDHYDLHEVTKYMAVVCFEHAQHKLAVWLSSIIILRQLYIVTVNKRLDSEVSALNSGLLHLLGKILQHPSPKPDPATSKENEG